MEDFMHKLREWSLIIALVVLAFGWLVLLWTSGPSHEGTQESVNDDYYRFENDEVVCYNFLGRSISCKWKD